MQQEPIARILPHLFADTSVTGVEVISRMRGDVSPAQAQTPYQFPLCGLSGGGEGEPVIEGGVPNNPRGDRVARVMIGSEDGVRRTIGLCSRIAWSLHASVFAATEANLSENPVTPDATTSGVSLPDNSRGLSTNTNRHGWEGDRTPRQLAKRLAT